MRVRHPPGSNYFKIISATHTDFAKRVEAGDYAYQSMCSLGGLKIKDLISEGRR